MFNAQTAFEMTEKAIESEKNSDYKDHFYSEIFDLFMNMYLPDRIKYVAKSGLYSTHVGFSGIFGYDEFRKRVQCSYSSHDATKAFITSGKVLEIIKLYKELGFDISYEIHYPSNHVSLIWDDLDVVFTISWESKK